MPWSSLIHRYLCSFSAELRLAPDSAGPGVHLVWIHVDPGNLRTCCSSSCEHGCYFPAAISYPFVLLLSDHHTLFLFSESTKAAGACNICNFKASLLNREALNKGGYIKGVCFKGGWNPGVYLVGVYLYDREKLDKIGIQISIDLYGYASKRRACKTNRWLTYQIDPNPTQLYPIRHNPGSHRSSHLESWRVQGANSLVIRPADWSA